MDALDPEQIVEIVGQLYKDDHFVSSLYNALTSEGVFVVQLGESDDAEDAGDNAGGPQAAAYDFVSYYCSLIQPCSLCLKLTAVSLSFQMEALQHTGFQSIHSYEDFHSKFIDPWSYLVSFKDSKLRASWYASPAEIELKLQQRILPSKLSGQSTLRYFDAATMTSYQLPTRADEITYCRREPAPPECAEEHRGINPQIRSLRSQLDVNTNRTWSAGVGLVTTIYSPVIERHLREKVLV